MDIKYGLTKAKFAGNGITTDFAVPFPYLLQSDVGASFYTTAGVYSGPVTSIEWLNPSMVRITPTPAVGQVVWIERFCGRKPLRVDFSDAATLTERDLDTAYQHAYFAAQEALEEAGMVLLSTTSIDGSVTAAQAAATSAGASATSAAVSAASAAANAALGLTYQTNAANSATAAAASAAAAASVVTSGLYVQKVGDNMTGTLGLPNGTAALPALRAVADATLGVFFAGNKIGFATGATERFSIQATGFFPATNGTLDIGAAGAKVRAAYLVDLVATGKGDFGGGAAWAIGPGWTGTGTTIDNAGSIATKAALRVGGAAILMGTLDVTGDTHLQTVYTGNLAASGLITATDGTYTTVVSAAGVSTTFGIQAGTAFYVGGSTLSTTGLLLANTAADDTQSVNLYRHKHATNANDWQRMNLQYSIVSGLYNRLQFRMEQGSSYAGNSSDVWWTWPSTGSGAESMVWDFTDDGVADFVLDANGFGPGGLADHGTLGSTARRWSNVYTNALSLVGGGGLANAGVSVSGATAAASLLNVSVNGVSKWQVNASGHLYPLTDVAINLGAGPSNRILRVTSKDYAWQSGSADPVAADIPASGFVVWKNTTSGTVKLWANDGGTLKSVALV